MKKQLLSLALLCSSFTLFATQENESTGSVQTITPPPYLYMFLEQTDWEAVMQCGIYLFFKSDTFEQQFFTKKQLEEMTFFPGTAILKIDTTMATGTFILKANPHLYPIASLYYFFCGEIPMSAVTCINQTATN